MTAVVVGAGLAGSAAALALAEAGVEVVQVAAAPGATALSGGTLDVAGASPGIPTLPWRDALRGTPLLPRERLALHRRGAPSHPWAQLFGAGDEPSQPEREVEAAVSKLAAWLAPAGLGLDGSLGANRLLATVAGTLRVADFAFAPAASGDLLAAQEIAVVDVPALEGFDARALARVLAREIEVLGLPKRPVSVVHPECTEPLVTETSPARVAARLDGAEARAALVRACEGLGGEGRVLLFPPILGISACAELVAALEAASGARVAEALAFPPFALAGFRLDRALGAALAAAGVRRLAARARRVGPGSGAGLRVALAEDDAKLDAEAVIVATGRFASGGLGADLGTVGEPLLGLPLYDADGRRVDGIPARRSARKGYGNPQPLFSAGVRTDRRLRPLGASGRPQHGRLFAAGDLLGGFDPARERTGLGVALVTGLRAARAAIEALTAPPPRTGDVP